MNRLMFIIATALLAGSTVSTAEQLRDERFQLSIERGTLASVLEQFSRQTGLVVGTEFSIATRPAFELGPFEGRVTADDAMRELLKESDLRHEWRDGGTIRLSPISTRRLNWSSGVITAKEASDSIRGLTGIHYDTGSCSNVLVGPFEKDESMTAEAFWIELIKHQCPVVGRRSSDVEPGVVDRALPAGAAEHAFSVGKMPRVLAFERISQQAGVAIRYLSTDADEELALVGPISGQLSLNEALSLAMHGSVLRALWVTDEVVRVEPAYTIVMYADMSTCRCNFGLPEFRAIQSENVTVEKPRLPSLEQHSPAPVAVLDRRFISASGAATIPELLNQLAQQAFTRTSGYRSNAAQYFEGRGFGAQYALVLIDGRRAYGSAGDPITNAFDLNAIPLSAVDRVEIALDQPSVGDGTDAIGGTVNIILRKDVANGASVSLGSAKGGAEKQKAALFVDGRWGDTTSGLVFEHLRRGDLLGSQRDRWRNQDYTRYPGGRDYRSPFGAPPNVHSITGNLPGIGASSAALVVEAGEIAARPHLVNRQSVLAYAAIEPEQERSSMYGFAKTAIGNANLNLDALVNRHTASLQVFPVEVQGLIWGAEHPQNIFGTDVRIDALLTGLPPRRHEVESTMKRLTAEMTGSVGEWKYSAFMVAQQDRSRAWIANEIDSSVLAHSLTTNDPTAALNIASDRPGSGRLPPGLLLQAQIDSAFAGATQLGFDLSGSLIDSPAGKVETAVGIARRMEDVRFDAVPGSLRRDVTSIFSHTRVPILSESRAPPLRSLDLAIGARRDLHSDVRDITTLQYSLAWQPLSEIRVHAGYSELFRPPLLAELYLPRFSYPMQIFDPQRAEVAPVTFVTGGNPLLHPTEGQSMDVGLSINHDNDWRASLNYWEVRMRDRISAVLIQDLIAAHAEDIQDRVSRGERTAADIAANVPGRVLAIDATRANFGVTSARGVDFFLERTIKSGIGPITSRIDITRTLNFRYRDLPVASVPMRDRAGVASVYGTIPSARAVASVELELDGLSAAVFARHHTSYKDAWVDGAAAPRRISAQTLFDIKLTKTIGDHVTLAVGVHNVLDDRPPFAIAGGWEGFDQSQGNLVGREIFLEVASSL